MARKDIGVRAVSGRDLATMEGVAKYDRTFLPVANGTHFNGNGGAASTSLIQTRCRQSRKLLRVIAGGADQLQVEWANIWTQNTPKALDVSCENAGPNNVIVRMSIEYPAGNMRIVSASSTYAAGTAYAVLDQVVSAGLKYVCIQAGTGQTPAISPAFWRLVRTYVVNWEGQTDTSGTVTFVPGDYKKSLPVSLLEKMIPGDLVAVLGAFDSGASSGTYIPYAGSGGASNGPPFVDWIVDAAGGMPAVGSSIVDTGITNQTNAMTTTLNSTNQSAWAPLMPYATALTGNIQTRRCVALFGDSLMMGTGGDIRDGEPAGVFVRSVDGTSYWKIAQGGNRAECYTPTNAPWQLSCAARCSGIITDLGVGDIQANLTFAQTKAAMERLWKTLAATGVPVYATLPMPIANSSDAWATLVNQSRWTNGGAAATTQFPTDDASYLTSIYGLISMWLSQDGATLTVNDTTAKVGQQSHPLEGILDPHGLIADPATSWKWNPGYTADGAHPNAVAAMVQADYLQQQMEPVILGRQQLAQSFPPWSPYGKPPVESFSRAMIRLSTATVNPAVNTRMSIIDVSPGRFFYGVRAFQNVALAAGSVSWSLLTGMDPAKMKVQATGTVPAWTTSTTPVAPAVSDFAIGRTWIPAGHVIAVALRCNISTTAGIAQVWGGYAAGEALAQSMIHKTGLGFLMAGSSADTAALSGTISLFDAVKFTQTAWRIWAEIY